MRAVARVGIASLIGRTLAPMAVESFSSAATSALARSLVTSLVGASTACARCGHRALSGRKKIASGSTVDTRHVRHCQNLQHGKSDCAAMTRRMRRMVRMGI